MFSIAPSKNYHLLKSCALPINIGTYLKATVTRVTGDPLSKAATKVLLGRIDFESLASLLRAGAAWA